ncbi:MAG: dipeptidase [Planctomycetaceae bacterium]|nr:dipeptidase [Planctomycetaceae bacterium]
MWFQRMTLEVWFDKYQYEVDYDIGESAVKYMTFDQLGVDLAGLPLRYGYHEGRPDLRELLAHDYPGFTGENVIVTSGGSEANFAIMSALCKPGDHVIVEHPNYASMYEVPRSLGCNVELFHLEYDNAFKPDIDKLQSMITPETKIVSLTHPNNPTGSMVTEGELRRIIEIIENNNTYLLFDETYREMCFDFMLPPASILSPRVISLSSMSKCYGIPGIRLGWAATQDKQLLAQLLAIREQISITNNVMSEAIALKVLADKEKFLANARRQIKTNRDYVDQWMAARDDFEWIFPEAGVVGFPRLKKTTGVDPEDLIVSIVENYRTFTIPGRCFESDNHHFRLGFGANLDEIKIGLDNVDKALAGLKQTNSPRETKLPAG